MAIVQQGIRRENRASVTQERSNQFQGLSHNRRAAMHCFILSLDYLLERDGSIRRAKSLYQSITTSQAT